MLKKVLEEVPAFGGETTVVLYYAPRWNDPPGFAKADGPVWYRSVDKKISYSVLEHDQGARGSVTTKWDANGKVIRQHRRPLKSTAGGPRVETRTSPPWWPHPPPIDLKEFEE